MVVTIHFIDNEWKLVSKVLDFVPFPGNHSGYKIFEICSGIIDEFRIKGRVLAFTTDNASNNDILIENLLLHGYLDSAESHQRCFAHVLNLSAQKALDEIRTSIEDIRVLGKLIRSSREWLRSSKSVKKYLLNSLNQFWTFQLVGIVQLLCCPDRSNLKRL